MAKISWRAQWMATVVGTVVGTGGYVWGLGHYVWPAHPGWALFFMTTAATVICMVVANEDEAPKVDKRV